MALRRSPSLSGGLPASWSGLSTLTSLDLSSNGLQSSIPDGWSTLSSLTSLDLSGNPNLCGPIPGAWSSIASLVTTGTILGKTCPPLALYSTIFSFPTALSTDQVSSLDLLSEYSATTGMTVHDGTRLVI